MKKGRSSEPERPKGPWEGQETTAIDQLTTPPYSALESSETTPERRFA